jgi:hypothetical protein
VHTSQLSILRGKSNDNRAWLDKRFDELGIAPDERYGYWHSLMAEKQARSREYRDHPPKSHKDNRRPYEGENTSCALRNIRYPSKKRKTAWGRFYKRYPHLHPDAIATRRQLEELAAANAAKKKTEEWVNTPENRLERAHQRKLIPRKLYKRLVQMMDGPMKELAVSILDQKTKNIRFP